MKRRGVMEASKVREIIRLSELGSNQTEISKICRISRSAIQDYQKLIKSLGLTFAEIKELSDSELQSKCGKRQPGRKAKKVELEPNFEELKTELAIKGVTLELLWQEWFKKNGNEGYSYSTFWRKYRSWERKSNVSFKRSYEPGEQGQFDYAGVTLKIYDKEKQDFKECPVFIGALCFSYLKYVEVSENAQIDHWIGSSIRAFEFFGGVPEYVCIDNLKTGVTKSCRYEPEIQKDYQRFSEHYHTAIIPARVKKPKDKSKVEKAVQDVERWVIAPLRNEKFYSIGEANKAIRLKTDELNNKILQDYKLSSIQLYQQYEKERLRPLPQYRYEYCAWKQATVSLDYHVQVGNHYYSVPYHLCKSIVNVKIGEHKIDIYHENKLIATHLKSTKPYRHTTIEAHMPPQHLAVANWNEENFLKWGEQVGQETLKQIQGLLDSPRHRQQSYRSILGVQRLAKTHGNHAVELACLQANKVQVFSQRYIKNLIQKTLVTTVHANVRGQDYYH